MIGKTQLGEANAVIRQAWEAMPWQMPSFAIPVPATEGATLTSRVSLSTANKTFSALKKKFQGVPVAYRLEGTNFDFDGVTLQDIEIALSNIGFRSYGSGTIRNLLVERMRMPSGIYTSGIPMGLIYSTNTTLLDAVIRDVAYNGSQTITNNENISAAIALTGKTSKDIGNNILIERFDIRNLIVSDPTPGIYKNADGISIERGYTNVTIRTGRVSRVSDGCYDIKSVTCRLDDVYGEYGRQTAKLWQPNHHGAIYSADPAFAHMILVDENGQDWADPIVFDHIDFRHSTGLAPVFRCEDGRRQIIVKSYDLSGLRPGTPLLSTDAASAASTIDWGLQGTPVI